MEIRIIEVLLYIVTVLLERDDVLRKMEALYVY